MEEFTRGYFPLVWTGLELINGLRKRVISSCSLFCYFASFDEISDDFYVTPCNNCRILPVFNSRFNH